MNTLNVLIVIDALGAATSNSLENNVHLVDNNKYLGSWNEGACNLFTVCQDGQLINWRVVAVSPNSAINITGITGDMVTKNVCVPQRQGIEGEYYWTGRIENKGSIGQFTYIVTLSIDGRAMSFSPYIKIV